MTEARIQVGLTCETTHARSSGCGKADARYLPVQAQAPIWIGERHIELVAEHVVGAFPLSGGAG
jgi:hypothetical protein